MLEKGFVTRAEWKAHIQTHPFVAHNVWPRIRNYVPAYGYSRTEIDALFEPTVGGKKQILYGNVIGLVAGAIPYGTGATGLVGATANLFYDAANQLFGVREATPTARVHINSVGGNVPALNLESGAEGELVTPDGQQLRFGHWNAGTTTFTERMKMDDAGKIFISYMTTGSVGFYGAGGELKQDNGNFFWDDVNKRLAINLGGGAPTDTLEVGGKLRLVGDDFSTIMATTAVGRQILILRGRSLLADGAGINLYGDGDASFAGMIRVWTNNVERLEINAAGQFDFQASPLVTTGTFGCNTFTMTSNSDTVVISHDGSDAYFKWSDGVLNLITDEGTNTNTVVNIKGKGTGIGVLAIYDQDDEEQVEIYNVNGVGYIHTGGTSPSRLNLQAAIAQDIRCWPNITSGNPSFYIYGFGASATEWLRMRVESDNDALIEAEHNLNIVAGGGAVFFGDENIGVNQSSFGTNAVGVLAQGTGITPTTSPADCFQMYSADIGGVAGKAGVHVRSEEGGILGVHGGAGTINHFTYQGDIADDGTFNLPAITDACWGFIQVGNNEEYALFTVDDDGDVTLIANSANVVANADTDANLCIGTAATQEPLVIKNRLGATKNINLVIWYS